MKPLIHAKTSARKYGGVLTDYLDIHNWMDSSKAHLADMRHRMLLHSSFGIYICEQVFGVYRRNSDNKDYSVRDIAEDHVMEDLGRIPSVSDWLRDFDLPKWAAGPQSKVYLENWRTWSERL